MSISIDKILERRQTRSRISLFSKSVTTPIRTPNAPKGAAGGAGPHHSYFEDCPRKGGKCLSKGQADLSFHEKGRSSLSAVNENSWEKLKRAMNASQENPNNKKLKQQYEKAKIEYDAEQKIIAAKNRKLNNEKQKRVKIEERQGPKVPQEFAQLQEKAKEIAKKPSEYFKEQWPNLILTNNAKIAKPGDEVTTKVNPSSKYRYFFINTYRQESHGSAGFLCVRNDGKIMALTGTAVNLTNPKIQVGLPKKPHKLPPDKRFKQFITKADTQWPKAPVADQAQSSSPNTPAAPSKPKHSYFGDCPRGKDGRCLPKGSADQSGQTQPNAESAPTTNTEAKPVQGNDALEKPVATKQSTENSVSYTSVPEQQKQADGIVDRFKNRIQSIMDQAPGSQQLRTIANKLHEKVAQRYGPDTAKKILASGMAISWGAFGIGAALDHPNYIPVSMAMLPGIAIAELYHQFDKMKEKSIQDGKNLTDEDIQKLADALMKTFEIQYEQFRKEAQSTEKVHKKLDRMMAKRFRFMTKDDKDNHGDRLIGLMRNNPALIKINNVNRKLEKEGKEMRWVPAQNSDKLEQVPVVILNEQYGPGWIVWEHPIRHRLAIASKVEVQDFKRGKLR